MTEIKQLAEASDLSWASFTSSRRHQAIVEKLWHHQSEPRMISDYFQSLQQEIKDRPLTNGKVVLGMSSGRCGSLSLTKLLSTIPNSCVTHETPISLDDVDFSAKFHGRRYDLLRKRYDLVFNIHPRTVNYVPFLHHIFPDIKIIALHRELFACADSFVKMFKYEGGTHYSEIVGMLLKYNTKFNDVIKTIPKNVFVVTTETLSEPETQKKILDFIGAGGTPTSVHANKDGHLEQRPWF